MVETQREGSLATLMGVRKAAITWTTAASVAEQESFCAAIRARLRVISPVSVQHHYKPPPPHPPINTSCITSPADKGQCACAFRAKIVSHHECRNPFRSKPPKPFSGQDQVSSGSEYYFNGVWYMVIKDETLNSTAVG